MGRHRSVATLRALLFPSRQKQVTPAPPLTVELVDGLTEVIHRVTDDAFAAGRRNGGCYRAVCGVFVLAASLTAPGRGHCPTCEWGGAPTRRRGGTRGD
jgi:hypothetical protein